MVDVATVGLIHPGAMGVTVGASMASAATVVWAGEGRSKATKDRANAARLTDVGSLSELVGRSSTIVSVCPPGEAVAVARSVADLGFAGTFVDANAVSPATARSIAAMFDDAVDGGIVGPPVRSPATTRLYLSGASAQAVGALFVGSHLEVRIVDGAPGAASALKMSFAAWTKGTSVLLLAINVLADMEGVGTDLRAEWATSMPELIARSEALPAGVGPKAWRFEGEMHQIADTFAAAGLHDGFHRAAADIYGRLAELKTADEPTLADVVRLLGEQ